MSYACRKWDEGAGGGGHLNTDTNRDKSDKKNSVEGREGKGRA